MLTWNQIHEVLAAAAGATARLVHVPSDAILAADERWGRSYEIGAAELATNSVVSVREGGEATVIANAEGARTTPPAPGPDGPESHASNRSAEPSLLPVSTATTRSGAVCCARTPAITDGSHRAPS